MKLWILIFVKLFFTSDKIILMQKNNPDINEREYILSVIVKMNYFVTGIKICAVFGLGYFAINFYDLKLQGEIKTTLNMIGILLIATAVLGRLGYVIQTIGGETKYEKSNIMMFRIFYHIGFFFISAGFFALNGTI